MESKLLKYISTNGTGILKGVYHSHLSLENVSPERPFLDVVMSLDGVDLGKHILRIDTFPLRLNGITCTMVVENHQPYEPLGGFGDRVTIMLVPFAFNPSGNCGDFVALYPVK